MYTSKSGELKKESLPHTYRACLRAIGSLGRAARMVSRPGFRGARVGAIVRRAAVPVGWGEAVAADGYMRQRRWSRLWSAPGQVQQVPDAGDQFLQAEGFADVVVAARIEALDHIGGLVFGGQEKDGGESGHFPAQRKAVAVGQHHVQHTHVGLELLQRFQHQRPCFDPSGVRSPDFPDFHGRSCPERLVFDVEDFDVLHGRDTDKGLILIFLNQTGAPACFPCKPMCPCNGKVAKGLFSQGGVELPSGLRLPEIQRFMSMWFTGSPLSSTQICRSRQVMV